MDIFHQEYAIEGKQAYKLYTADLWAVSLGREVRVAIVDYIDTDRKRQTRKVFFSTDLSLSAQDIFDIYRTRFQLEFVYRDAKQYTGLTHCQSRNKAALSFAFNAVNRNKKCSDFGKKNYSGNGNSLCSNFGNNSAVTVVLN